MTEFSGKSHRIRHTQASFGDSKQRLKNNLIPQIERKSARLNNSLNLLWIHCLQCGLTAAAASFIVNRGSFYMTFRLDINRAIAATAFLIQKAGGEHDMFVLLKTLYHADRSSLIKDHRTITGDNFVSMDKGPVLTRIYDLMKGKGDASALAKWRQHFSAVGEKYGVKLENPPDLDYLSENEKQTLSESFDIISSIDPQYISRWMHATFPEWKDPHGSSIPIDPKIILRSQNVSESEIVQIEEETDALKFAKLFLG